MSSLHLEHPTKVSQYCSEECRAADKTNHKAHCVARLEKERKKKNISIESKPAGAADDGFWAKYEATNIMCLEDAEGLHLSHPFRMLILGSTCFPANPFLILTSADSGLRHFIYSINQVLQTPNYKVQLVINDPTPNHLVRTILGTLLLTQPTINVIFNAEAFVHLWYSAKLPKQTMDYIRSVVEGPLREAHRVVKYIAESTKTEGMIIPVKIPERSIPVRIHLTAPQWEEVMAFLDPPQRMTPSIAECVRNLDVAKRPEMTDLMCAQLDGARAASMNRWRADGILLPYGHSRGLYDTLNP